MEKKKSARGVAKVEITQRCTLDLENIGSGELWKKVTEENVEAGVHEVPVAAARRRLLKKPSSRRQPFLKKWLWLQQD